MTREEFADVAMRMRSLYPKENLFPTNEAMTLWYEQLFDIPYQVAVAALRKWCQTEKWSPSISELRSAATEITAGPLPDWNRAWETVQEAIDTCGTWWKERAEQSFDEVTRRVVRQLGWENICHNNIDVTRANFRMVYENEVRRHREDRQINPELLAKIQELRIGDGGRPYFPEAGNGSLKYDIDEIDRMAKAGTLPPPEKRKDEEGDT